MQPKNVLITGATSGIGQQLAIDYALAGWHVFACGRDQPRFAAWGQERDNVTFVQFDATNKAETINRLQAIESKLDLIIFNAGVCEYLDEGKIVSELFERVFAVNFFGALHCMEGLTTQLVAGCHLAFMGSSAAYVALPRAEAYGASKAALSYLARSLALDLESRGVTVSLISPGFVKTRLTDRNDFSMPMIIDVVSASAAIRAGLEKKQMEIHFPKKFSLLLKIIAMLPYRLQHRLVKKITRKK